MWLRGGHANCGHYQLGGISAVRTLPLPSTDAPYPEQHTNLDKDVHTMGACTAESSGISAIRRVAATWRQSDPGRIHGPHRSEKAGDDHFHFADQLSGDRSHRRVAGRALDERKRLRSCGKHHRGGSRSSCCGLLLADRRHGSRRRAARPSDRLPHRCSHRSLRRARLHRPPGRTQVVVMSAGLPRTSISRRTGETGGDGHVSLALPSTSPFRGNRRGIFDINCQT